MEELDLAALILRCTLGGVMFAHGWNHVFGAGGIAGTAGWFGGMGLRWPRAQAIASGATEIATGVGLVVGVFTTLQAAAVVGVMSVALVIAHARNGFFIFREGQGWEYVAFIAAVAVAVATLGPGAASVDNLLGLDVHADGWVGLVGAAVLGTAGGAGLLVICWRPTRADENETQATPLATNRN